MIKLKLKINIMQWQTNQNYMLETIQFDDQYKI